WFIRAIRVAASFREGVVARRAGARLSLSRRELRLRLPACLLDHLENVATFPKLDVPDAVGLGQPAGFDKFVNAVVTLHDTEAGDIPATIETAGFFTQIV